MRSLFSALSFQCALVALGVLGLVSNVSAYSVTPPATLALDAVSGDAKLVAWGPNNSFSSVNNQLLATYTHNYNVDRGTLGAAIETSSALYYETQFTPPGSSDISGAIVDFSNAGFTFSGEKRLMVKDGNQTPGWYVFDISTWNGTDQMVLTNFWPGNGEISHITIFGTLVSGGGGGNVVPEPTSMTLLGLGLACVAGRRAFRRKAA